MEFLNPVARVGNEKLPYWPAVLPIEINRVSPFVLFVPPQIIIRKRAEIVSVRPEVIVNDVKNDAESKRMCAIDKRPQIIGCSIESRRREKVDTVVTPAKAARKIGNRHHFQQADPAFLELG